jgi:hypothetical protein
VPKEPHKNLGPCFKEQKGVLIVRRNWKPLEHGFQRALSDPAGEKAIYGWPQKVVTLFIPPSFVP